MPSATIGATAVAPPSVTATARPSAPSASAWVTTARATSGDGSNHALATEPPVSSRRQRMTRKSRPRVLTLTLLKPGFTYPKGTIPTVTIDGHEDLYEWGTHEIPIRVKHPTVIDCVVPEPRAVGRARFVVPEGRSDVSLDYVAPYWAVFPGRIGAAGSVDAAGRLVTVAMWAWIVIMAGWALLAFIFVGAGARPISEQLFVGIGVGAMVLGAGVALLLWIAGSMRIRRETAQARAEAATRRSNDQRREASSSRSQESPRGTTRASSGSAAHTDYDRPARARRQPPALSEENHSTFTSAPTEPRARRGIPEYQQNVSSSWR